MSPDAQGWATRADVHRALLVLDQLPDLIVETRTRRGHSVRAAAKKIGIDYTNLSRIENRLASPSIETSKLLLAYLVKTR